MEGRRGSWARVGDGNICTRAATPTEIDSAAAAQNPHLDRAVLASGALRRIPAVIRRMFVEELRVVDGPHHVIVDGVCRGVGDVGGDGHGVAVLLVVGGCENVEGHVRTCT